MHTLICGSVAYDTIMVFEGHFRDQILPDQIHILNVAFIVPEMRREFGGCAGNIAYNLRLLGGHPLIMATVGEDAAPYFKRLEDLGLDSTHVVTVPKTFTAQAFITTDIDDNQITAFHPGAMGHSGMLHVSDAKQEVSLGIVSPDSRDGMIQHAREFADAGIPFFFDPGQALPMFSGADLNDFIDLAPYVTVNDYEAQLLVERTGISIEAHAARGKVIIVTLGAEGSHIYVGRTRHLIACVPAKRLADPTGCGDAYRSGLLYGLANGMDWETSARLASTMGAFKIEQKGPQNHDPSRDEIAERFSGAYGYRPW